MGCFGCAGFRQPDANSYELPDETDAGRGMFSEFTRDVSTSFRTAMGRGPSEEAAKQEYLAAMEIYNKATSSEGHVRRSLFDSAGKAFGNAATRWPKSAIEEDAMFYRAESAFFADRYPRAQTIFAELAAKYPATRYADKVSQRRFQIAKYWLDHHEQDPSLPDLSQLHVARSPHVRQIWERHQIARTDSARRPDRGTGGRRNDAGCGILFSSQEKNVSSR